MNLIIQGPDVETRDLKELAKLTGASAIEQIARGAFRLAQAAPAAGVAERCARAQLDFAFVPAGCKLADFRLAVMDMDSTLIAVETIDEIADLMGLKPQVAAITAAAMRGEVEYRESLRRRVALLAGLDEAALGRVYDERLQLSPGADRLLARCRRLGIKTLLVSGGFTFFTDRLKARLGLDYARANVLAVRNGKLTGEIVGDIVDAEGKRAALVALRNELGYAREQVLGLGDGANDLKFLAEAGVSIAYRAKPVVRAQATYALNFAGLDGVLNLFD